MVAPIEVRVPPVAYGGIEIVVSVLTEELVHRGHDVTLYASGDSITNATLVSVIPEHTRKSKQDTRLFNALNLIKCLENSSEYDVIHSHVVGPGLLSANLVSTPVLTTPHGPLDPESAQIFPYYKGWYNAISKSAASLVPRTERFAGVVYNSIDCSKYPFNHGNRGDYLLFFSRFSPEKGAHDAIRVAKKLGMPLVLAGNISEPAYFKNEILPLVDGKKIRCETEVSPERKKDLMMNARCLLAPITWNEPFGLFMAEAQACGTPVIGNRFGAAPEIVEDGKTGFIVDSLAQMISCVKKVDRIDSQMCRRRILDRFDLPQLADSYLAAYRRIISKTVATAPKVVIKN
jgi:glycosyltransferase involved in cell wall biosynthesis